MRTTRVESLPASWDDARDIPFFRTTARLFSPDFCLGASVLLASYDDDRVDPDLECAQRRAGSPGVRTVESPTRDADLVRIPVPRNR